MSRIVVQGRVVRNDYRAKLAAWVDAAERRYAGDLRLQEITRALRALSATYVERRERGGQHVHGALDTAGKRAAFALYYAPLHFIAVAEVVRLLGANECAGSIVDLGCGTGAAGAAWALTATPTPPLVGIDRHPWAVAEARWTFAQFGLNGRAKQSELDRLGQPPPDSNAIAAYTLNELSDTSRERVERWLFEVVRRGGSVLILEPLARGVAPWWAQLADRLTAVGGRADEWKLTVDVPPLVQRLGIAAGLNYRELKFQTIFAGLKMGSIS